MKTTSHRQRSTVNSLVYCLIIPSLIAGSKISANDHTSEVSAVDLTIHYSDGLPSTSAIDALPRILLRPGQVSVYLVIRNNSKDSLILWQLDCPPGDDAIRIEFKSTPTSKDVSVATISQIYTRGMGIPKTFELRRGDELIAGFNFLSYWKFPFNYDFDVKTVYVRAVYESKSIDKFYDSKTAISLLKFTPKAKKVWHGTVRTSWQKVEIVNLTGNKNPLGGAVSFP